MHRPQTLAEVARIVRANPSSYAMPLDEFCDDCRDALSGDTGPGGREVVRMGEGLVATKGVKYGKLVPATTGHDLR